MDKNKQWACSHLVLVHNIKVDDDFLQEVCEETGKLANDMTLRYICGQN